MPKAYIVITEDVKDPAKFAEYGKLAGKAMAGATLLAFDPAPQTLEGEWHGPQTVLLEFESDPPGAETRLVGDDTLLGQTPFRLTKPADGDDAQYEMRLAGYAPRRDRVVLAPGTPTLRVGGALRKLAPAAAHGPRAPAPARRKKASRNATLNPFAR
jgi:hypothetical protein